MIRQTAYSTALTLCSAFLTDAYADGLDLSAAEVIAGYEDAHDVTLRDLERVNLSLRLNQLAEDLEAGVA
jgi:hypothetical protein